jgi:hypothetical protein
MPGHEYCGSSWVPPQNSFRFHLGASRYHVTRGELDLAQRLDEDLLRLSCQRNDPAGWFWVTTAAMDAGDRQGQIVSGTLSFQFREHSEIERRPSTLQASPQRLAAKAHPLHWLSS